MFFRIHDIQSCLCLEDMVNFVNLNVNKITTKSHYIVIVKVKKVY